MPCEPTVVFKRTKVFVKNDSYKSLKKLVGLAELLEQRVGSRIFDAEVFSEVVERFRKNRIKVIQRSIARTLSGRHLSEDKFKIDSIKDSGEFCAFAFKPDMHAWGDLLYEALGNFIRPFLGYRFYAQPAWMARGLTVYPWSKQRVIEIQVNIPVRASESSSFRELERLIVKAVKRHMYDTYLLNPAERPSVVDGSYKNLFGRRGPTEILQRIFRAIKAIEARSLESGEIGGIGCWFNLECRGRGRSTRGEEKELEAFYNVSRATEHRVNEWVAQRGGHATLSV